MKFLRVGKVWMRFSKSISEDIFRIHTHTKYIKSATLLPKHIE